MMKKNENEKMNILKAIAIILMVMGHAGSPFNKYLYLFHLPTFIFVSGYFYKEIYNDNFYLLLKSRIKSLYIPYVKYVILFIILNNFLFKLNLLNKIIVFNKESIIVFIKGIVTFNSPIDILGSFWFIKTLFLCTILFGLISYVLKKLVKRNFESNRAIVITLIFLIGNIIILKYGNVSMQNIIKVSMCLPIFYLGVLYKKHEKSIIENRFITIIFIIILFISANQGSIDIANGLYTNAIFFIGNAILGVYVLLNISNKIIKVDKYKILNYIGKNTLPILASHWICFELANNLLNIEDINIRWIIYTLFGVIIPIIIDLIIKKIKNRFIKNK